MTGQPAMARIAPARYRSHRAIRAPGPSGASNVAAIRTASPCYPSRKTITHRAHEREQKRSR